MRDFSNARYRSREGSRSAARGSIATGRRQTTWPGESPPQAGNAVEIRNRDEGSAAFVRVDVLRKRRIAAIANQQLIG